MYISDFFKVRLKKGLLHLFEGLQNLFKNYTSKTTIK